MSEPRPWEVLNSLVAFDSPWLRVRRDTVRTGRDQILDDYYVVERRDYGMVVALTEDEKVILVREYKHGAGQVLLQCPAGYLDDDEQPDRAVLRELLEETGYTATEVSSLGAYFVSTGMVTTRGHLFLCRGATLQHNLHERDLDEAEEIEVVLLPFKEALLRVADGTLTPDMATVAALLRAQQVLSH